MTNQIFKILLNNLLEKLKLHATFKIIMHLKTTYSGGHASPGIWLLLIICVGVDIRVRMYIYMYM